MSLPRAASTVLLLRAGAQGPEILLVRRARSMGFFPDAWVFPGGRVDESDGIAPAIGHPSARESELRAYIVAAARECFEEAGLWLGPHPLGELHRAELLSGRSGLDRIHEAVVDVDLFRLWSWWVTPEQEPRRYDTRFLLARLPQELRTEAKPDGTETTAIAWHTPAAALQLHRQGQLPLAPPTFRTLEELAPFASVDAIWTDAAGRQVRAIQPHLRLDLSDSEGPAIILPGDELHPDPHPAADVTRLVLRGGCWHSVRRQAPGAVEANT